MTATALAKHAATGSLIGLALGDALGFPTEFNDVPSILAKCGPWREMELPKPAIVTDDTQMTLALGRGLRTAMGPRGPGAEAHDPPGARGVRRLVPLPGQQPGTRTDLPRRLQPAGRRQPALAGGEPDRLQGLRGQHAGGARRTHTRAQRRTARRGRPVAGGAHPRPPTALAASDLTAHAIRLLVQGAEPSGLVGQLRSYAYENRSRYHESWLGDLWTRAQDPTAEHFIARGWDECLEILERLQAAVATVSPETDPCLATGEGWIAEEALATGLLCFLLFPTSRSPYCAGPPAPPATPTRSHALRGPSRAPTSAPRPGRGSGRTASSTGANCRRSGPSGTCERAARSITAGARTAARRVSPDGRRAGVRPGLTTLV